MALVTTPSVFEALDIVMRYYPNKFTIESKAEIETLLDHCLDELGEDSEKLLTALFIKALKSHTGPVGADEHIYLKKFEIPQIELFNLLIEQFPLVKYSHEITNASIAKRIEHCNHATIVDIGIGQGVQMLKLIQKLKCNKNLIELTIIGIEPFSDALIQCGQKIKEVSAHFKINFIGINSFIEETDFDTLQKSSQLNQGPIIVNASLALHHIPTLEGRNRVCNLLWKLKPDAIFLAEPNSDHFEPDFYKRFKNCHEHFTQVFKVIDSLDISAEKKNGLKLFFGREIEDIIGKSNLVRFEKHTRTDQWLQMMDEHGFASSDYFYAVPKANTSGIDIDYNPKGYLSFGIDNDTILGLMHFIIK